jgi:2-iminobutanoate/2-iminopropanoate deaminase
MTAPTIRSAFTHMARASALALILLLVVGGAPCALAQAKRTVQTDNAPKAIGPYNQAVIAGNTVYVSGQLGIDPATGRFIEGTVKEQTRQALDNLAAILDAAGSKLSDVVSCTVYLKDMNDFATMNDAYATRFPANPPARATVQVARLPKDGLVEISCVAVLP